MKRGIDAITEEVLGAFDARCAEDAARLDAVESEELKQAEDFRRATESGHLSAHGLYENGVRIGTCWCGVSEDYDGRVLWVAGMSAESGSERGLSAFKRFGRALSELARREGCAKIKAETSRSGVFRELLRLGFKPERVELAWEHEGTDFDSANV